MGALPRRARHLHAHQSNQTRQACRRHRRKGTARPARPRAHDPLLQEGDDLARRQLVLWTQADLRARVPRLAQGFPAAGVRPSPRERRVRADFPGPWTHTTMWEIPALAIINELRSRAALNGLGRFTLDVLYARAK